jgi:hypothetical protein
MDQHESHLQADRVVLLLKAADAVTAYVKQNPEPLPEHYPAEEPEQPIADHESGQ